MANLNLITDPVFIASDAFGISSVDITNWNTAFGWGNHALAGYATASNAIAFTNKTGNISQWTNDSGYLTSVATPTLQQVTTVGNTTNTAVDINTSSNSSFALQAINTGATNAHGLYVKSDNGIPFRADIGANIYGQLNGGGRWLLGQNATDDGLSALQVNGFGRSNAGWRASDGTIIADYSIDGASGGFGSIGMTSNHPFIFRTNNTDRIYLAAAGNIGLGTTTPQSKIEIVSGALFFTGGGGFPTTGDGLSIQRSGSLGLIRSRNYTGATDNPLTITSSTTTLQSSTSIVLQSTLTTVSEMLQVGGPFVLDTTVITTGGAFVLDNTHNVIINKNTSGTPVSMTLPTPASNLGKTYIIADTKSSDTLNRIDFSSPVRYGGNTYTNIASIVIALANAGSDNVIGAANVTIISDATEWIVIGI